ncbi:MAG TPA: halocarboxylic acid dehydrogenase DehI family protein [Candidatus Eremiobacteraceae bacterium]|nr:halocarboxylic acid dehydrogenase DehI family protein [Candidatus Eremiobacteraceae bacterium]
MKSIPLVRDADVSDDRVKEAYRDFKESMRVSFVDSMFQAYAATPKFLDYAWRRLRPSMLSAPFVEQGRRVADIADDGVASWPVSDHAAELHARNYGDADLRKLRDIVEIFHGLLPKLAIVSQALRVALGGEPIGGGGVSQPPQHDDRDRLVRDFRGLQVPMADDREAPLRVRNAFDEMQRVAGLSFVSTAHRALGAYPDWLDVVWSDVKPMLADVRRRDLCNKVDAAAQEAAQHLPYPLNMPEGEFDAMKSVNDAFCSILPGLIVDIAVARRGLGPEPTT